MRTAVSTLAGGLARYGSYPFIVGSTAIFLFGGLARGWPYFPTVPLTVGAALAMVALLERQLPFHKAWLKDHRDTGCDAVHAAVNLAVLLAVHGVIAALTNVWAPGTIWPSQWPLWAQALTVGAVLDLSLYAVHWISHRSAWLWRFHAIHHSSERLYWLNGERRHPLHAGIMAAPGLVTVVLLGAPAIAVGAWLGLLAVHLAFQHSNLDYRMGPFKFLIGAAEVHRWHHKREYEDAQVNFGEFWMVWDHLFGTFKLPATQLGPTDVGLNEKDFPTDYKTQLIYPFVGGPASSRETRSDEGARIAYAREASMALANEGRGDVVSGWRAFELAHVIAQPHFGLHLQSHISMLGFAWRLGHWSEVWAQVVRLLLVPIAHLLKRVPIHNVGTGRVGLTRPGEWPVELNPRTLERR